MNNLQVIENIAKENQFKLENGQPFVSSLYISEVTEKEHNHIMRDIRKILEESDLEFGKSNFGQSSYTNSQNKQQPMFWLTEDGSSVLLGGYSISHRVKIQKELRQLKQPIHLEELSPNLQLINQMFQAMASNELESKRMRKEITEVKQTIYLVKDAMAEVKEYWRDWVSENINKIVHARGGSKSLHEETRSKSYELLEQRASCDLSARVRNTKKRLAEEGATKTTINSVRKLDAVESDSKLKQIYTSIIRELIIKYAA